MNSNISSSVAAPAGLKLEQLEQADQQGGRAASCLVELRLGISSSDSGSSPPWPVDPWSLAARQDNKASFHKCDPQSRENSAAGAAPPHQPVGWPPVRAFRKNLSSGSKPAAWDAGLLFGKQVKLGSEEDRDYDHGAARGGERPAPAPMLVKVNLEGCAFGRKVDLHAHRGYGSLSRALQSMFRGFLLSDGQWRIAAGNKDDEDEEEQKQQPPETKTTTKGPSNNKTTYVLLYEDNEGDRMLVGDVPWELFVCSVKRLYIARDTRTRAKS